MSAPEPIFCTRVVASPAALDALATDAVALRLAPDDLLLVGAVDVRPDDPDAIVCRDDGWALRRMTAAEASALVADHGDWSVPPAGIAQGALAGLPVKLLIDPAGDALLLVPRPYLADAVERLP